MPLRFDAAGKPKWYAPETPCVFCADTGVPFITMHEPPGVCSGPCCRCHCGAPIRAKEGRKDG